MCERGAKDKEEKAAKGWSYFGEQDPQRTEK